MNNGFQQANLGDILTRSEEWIDIWPNKQYRQVTVRLWGKGVVQRDEVSGAEIAADRRFVIRSQQFILSRIDARNGAFGIVPDSLNGAVVSSDFPVFVLDQSQILPQFLDWMSKTRDFVNLCKAASEGTTNRVRLQEERFLAAKISLPSLEEQHRIVARIEELAARIEEARGLRREAVKGIGIFLSEVVTRVLNDNQWATFTLGSLLRENTRNGLSAYPSDNPPGSPILRISAATSRQDAIIDEQDYKYIELDDRDIIRYKVDPGDLLACRFNGNLHYVGRFALYKGYSGKTQVYPDKLIRFRLDTEKVLPEFARFAVNSSSVRQSIEALCATTAGNIGISATDLKTITIPVPPLSEQEHIVIYLDNMQSKLASLKQLQSETSAELDALLPSILDKAFKGEL